MIEYRLPEINDEELMQEYVQENLDNGEDGIVYHQSLLMASYPEWAIMMRNKGLVGDNEWGKAMYFLCFDEGRLIGTVSVRPEISPELTQRFGHAGYRVRPSERRKGYATKMLEKAVEDCRAYGLKEMILGCDYDNYGSNKTIQRCGGIFIERNSNYAPHIISNYYKIVL